MTEVRPSTPELERVAVRAAGLSWEVGFCGREEGDCVLLLHGFPEHWTTWSKIMQPLAAEGFRACAPCLPGYGSTTPPASYLIDDVASDVMQLCAALTDEPVHLVGHDWGGIIACAAGALDPERFRSITAACCAHPAVFSSGRRDPRQMARSWYVAMFQLPGVEYALGYRSVIERLTPAVTEIDDPEAMRRALAYYRANLRPWKLQVSRARRVRVPGLVIHASRDVAITERLMRATAAQFDDLRDLAVLECGHFIQKECPDDLLEALIPFLRAT